MSSNKPSEQLSPFERYKELSTKQVAEYIGVSNYSSVWRYVQAGKLPQPRYLTAHKPIWRFGEVIDHTHALMQTPNNTVQGFKGESLARDVHEKSSKLKKRLGLS